MMEQTYGRSAVQNDRPWGWYLTLAASDDRPIAAVKVLVVLPGQELSLQKHDRRSEEWTPLGGGLRAVIGGKEGLLVAGHTYVVPQGTLHRLQNVGDHPVRLVEVMYGEYDEDDIVRLEDRYGRTT